MQFGKANERLWRKLVTANPRFGPIHMCKIDTSDGFYRVHLSTSSVLKLGACLPRFPSLPPLVAFPMVLPMGWTESPPFFCSFTKTACDLANHDLVRRRRAPPHRLEHLAALGDFRPNPERGLDPCPARPAPKSHAHQTTKAPLACVDVFVDDFLGIGQDHPSNPLTNQGRVPMNAIDKIFRPADADDHEWRKEPQSESKLKKQDASFQTLKRGLGWDHAIQSKNLLVAPHRQEKLAALLDTALHRKRFQLRDWQSLVGQLRSLTPGLPGSLGHFSVLQAVQQATTGARVRVTAMAKTALTTFQRFLQDDTRPTHLEELVPGRPIHIGACDAAKSGAGGAWFAAEDEALAWRKPFPPHIQDQVVSSSNPRGQITNSDLELSGTIPHQDVLGQHTPTEGETAHAFCDNTPTMSWRDRGSLTSTKAAAFLLQDATLMQRDQRCRHQHQHISGDDNRMADDASRHSTLEALPPEQADELRRDVLALTEEVAAGVAPSRVAASRTAWRQWSKFCCSMGWDPGLSHADDPIPYLLLFGRRWRDGRLAPRGQPTLARTAEDTVRQVGQAFALVGALDPHLNRHGRVDLRLSRACKSWKREDGPSQRKRPVPRTVLMLVSSWACPTGNPQQQATVDLMWLGCFWLLRPSECLCTNNHQSPFTLSCVILRCGIREFRGHLIPIHLLDSVTSAGFHFEIQKNGISGDLVLHGDTPDPVRNPRLSVIRRVQHLRQHSADPTTPLCRFCDENHRPRRIASSVLTSFLRMGTAALDLDVDITAGALRCTGATAAMEGQVAVPLIKLLGRWRSDEVFRYLHLQSDTLMAPIANQMLQPSANPNHRPLFLANGFTSNPKSGWTVVDSTSKLIEPIT